jgi:hypothetical protein
MFKCGGWVLRSHCIIFCLDSGARHAVFDIFQTSCDYYLAVMDDRLYFHTFAMAITFMRSKYTEFTGEKDLLLRPYLSYCEACSGNFKPRPTYITPFIWLTVASVDNEATTLRNSLSYLGSQKKLDAIWLIIHLG